MEPTPPPAVPWRQAIVVGVAVLGAYLVSLAPTVTFWDAGEFITAAKVVGIPHPPGAPLFVLLGHVWALLVPVGEFAFRTNMLSAVVSATAAGFWYLSVYELLRPWDGSPSPDSGRRIPGLPGLTAHLGGASAALIGAFGITNWQNSNETEVYAVSTFTIGAACWLALRWRAMRLAGRWSRSERLLLLALYLIGLSVGNHLLGLLVGPAILVFLVHELRYHRRVDLPLRRREWTYVAVFGSLWILMVGAGLGNGPVLVLGASCYAVSLTLAQYHGGRRFALLALPVSVIGITPFLALFLRAQQRPAINEGDPSTVAATLAVVRRDQYPPRSILDDPTAEHGPDNPGRSLSMIGLQVANYVQYFDWQWAFALGGRFPIGTSGLDARTGVTLLFLSLGLLGAFRLHGRDPPGAWLLGTLFLVTSAGLLLYMNFRPGHSIGYDLFPDPSQHEVRERDYFFVASFISWGVLAGIGLATAVRSVVRRAGPLAPAGVGFFAFALVPLLANGSAASRRHGPDARLAADFAVNLLNSVPPYGILFTFGDNDTFPLWWAQEVAGVRRDVSVVCLALADTRWYMRQLREMPIRPFDADKAPSLWEAWSVGDPPQGPLHSLTDAEIDSFVPQVLAEPVRIRYPNGVLAELEAGRPLYARDVVSIRILQENLGRRPIVWGLGAAGSFYGLDALTRQQGLVIRLDTNPGNPDSDRYDQEGLLGVPVDIPLTRLLVDSVYRFPRSGLFVGERIDRTAASIAATLALPLRQLGAALLARGDSATGLVYLRRAGALSPRSVADLPVPD